MMKEHIQEMRGKIREDLSHAHSGAELKEFFSTYLGRNGSISALMKELGKLSKEERPAAGKLINEFRDEVLASFKKSEEEIAQKELADKYREQLRIYRLILQQSLQKLIKSRKNEDRRLK